MNSSDQTVEEKILRRIGKKVTFTYPEGLKKGYLKDRTFIYSPG
jgi:hypothetical protein